MRGEVEMEDRVYLLVRVRLRGRVSIKVRGWEVLGLGLL